MALEAEVKSDRKTKDVVSAEVDNRARRLKERADNQEDPVTSKFVYTDLLADGAHDTSSDSRETVRDLKEGDPRNDGSNAGLCKEWVVRCTVQVAAGPEQ